MIPVNHLILSHAAPLLPEATGLAPTGDLEHPVDAVLMDVYGTLFISASGDIHSRRPADPPVAALGTLVEKYGFPFSPENLAARLEDRIRETHALLRAQGVDYPEVRMDRIWSGLLQSDDLDRVMAFALEFEVLTNPVYPMPGLMEILQELHRRNVRMGIISNAQFYTPYLFEAFLGSDLRALGFSEALILFSYAFNRAKPSLSLFETAKSRLARENIPAHHVLFVGNDMLNDIMPAFRIGFRTALFAGDARSLRLREKDPRCEGIRPDLVITDLIQILDWV